MRGCVRVISVAGIVSLALAAAGCGSGAGGGERLDRLTFMVGSAPGGSEDTFARLLQGPLQESLGTTVVVQNQEGANGNTAAATTFQKGSDCSYILAVNIPAFLTGAVEDGVPFKSSDFSAIVQVKQDFGDLLVLSDSKWNSLQEFLADAKANPGEITVSVQSIDSSNGKGLQNLEEAAGVKFNIVAFGGSGGKARDALVGNQVDANASNVFNGQDIADRTRVLGVFQPENKWKSITDNAPTVDSVVGKQVPDVSTLYGVAATKKCQTDHPDLYKRLEDALLKASASSSYKEALDKINQGGTQTSVPADQFRKATDEQAKLFGVPTLG